MNIDSDICKVRFFLVSQCPQLHNESQILAAGVFTDDQDIGREHKGARTYNQILLRSVNVNAIDDAYHFVCGVIYCIEGFSSKRAQQ